MAPDEALKANIKIIEAISKQGGKVYLSHPMTRKEIAPAATDIGRNLDINIIARANGSNYQEILKDHLSLDDYADEMIKNVMENGVDPVVMNKENIESLQNKGELASVFHGGFSGDPYAVLVKYEVYGHTYGADGMYRTISELQNNENYTPAEKIDLNKIQESIYGRAKQLSKTGQQVAQEYVNPMPPPLPNQGLTPPPLTGQSQGNSSMPPPLPNQGLTTSHTQFQGMSKSQQYYFLVSLRHGTNPLLTHVKQNNSNTRSNVPINQALLSQKTY